MKWLFWYVVGISLLAMVLTVADKLSAKAGGRRVPERTLLIVGALGGAWAEWMTMQVIRHKTRHNRFMLGLPLLGILHAVLAGALVIYAIL